MEAISTNPSAGLALTLAVYSSAVVLQRRAGGLPLLNPTAISIAVLITLLARCDFRLTPRTTLIPINDLHEIPSTNPENIST